MLTLHMNEIIGQTFCSEVLHKTKKSNEKENSDKIVTKNSMCKVAQNNSIWRKRFIWYKFKGSYKNNYFLSQFCLGSILNEFHNVDWKEVSSKGKCIWFFSWLWCYCQI